MPWSNDNTGSEGKSSGEADDVHARGAWTGRQGRGCGWDTHGTWANAGAHGPAKEQEGAHRVAQQDSTHSSMHSSMQTKTPRQDKTQMFAAGCLDTIYLLWESPLSDLSRDPGYLRVPN